jgi:putative ABC transport system permease protein
MYVPAAQVKDAMNVRNNRLFPITWVVRTDNANPAIGAAIQQELQAISGGRALGRILTMHQVIAASSARVEFTMTVLTVFACIALLLAGGGLYSLMSYSVQQRAPEIGIRMALGAESSDVRSLVVSQGFSLVLIGIAIGIPLGLALARVTISFVFGIQAWDPVLLAVVAMVFLLVALIAAWIPSVRATRVNPANALKS